MPGTAWWGSARTARDRNAKFKAKEGLPFPLLSDEDHAVAEAFGAWGTKSLYGKKFEGLIRSTFLVGTDGNARPGMAKRQGQGTRRQGHRRTARRADREAGGARLETEATERV